MQDCVRFRLRLLRYPKSTSDRLEERDAFPISGVAFNLQMYRIHQHRDYQGAKLLRLIGLCGTTVWERDNLRHWVLSLFSAAEHLAPLTFGYLKTIVVYAHEAIIKLGWLIAPPRS